MSNTEKSAAVIAEARRAAQERQGGYREQALKIFPHVCGRCCREFEGKKLRELTVHHRDHNHDNNPPDGSNWELLCIYCHEQEHIRALEEQRESDGAGGISKPSLNHSPFAALAALKGDK
jgi:hypothetical protein